MKNTSKIFPSFSCMACSYIDSDVFVFSFVYLWFSLYLQLGVYGVYSICLSYFPENEEPRITSIKELLVNNWGHIEWTITEENKNFKKLKRRNWVLWTILHLWKYHYLGYCMQCPGLSLPKFSDTNPPYSNYNSQTKILKRKFHRLIRSILQECSMYTWRECLSLCW